MIQQQAPELPKKKPGMPSGVPKLNVAGLGLSDIIPDTVPVAP